MSGKLFVKIINLSTLGPSFGRYLHFVGYRAQIFFLTEKPHFFESVINFLDQKYFRHVKGLSEHLEQFESKQETSECFNWRGLLAV